MKSSLRVAGVCLLSSVAGCWVVAGLDERDESREDVPEDCPNVFPESLAPACRACLRSSCCQELRDCAARDECLTCTRGDIPCTHPGSYDALQTCVVGCAHDCAGNFVSGLPEPNCNVFVPTPGGACIELGGYFGRIRCNPVSNAPCDIQRGESCGFDPVQIVFDCHASGHYRSVCEPCGPAQGLCGPGLMCINSRCYKPCCDGSECNGGECLIGMIPEIEFGACVCDTSQGGLCVPP